MDSHHATGCSLLGLAFSIILVRIMWIASPPFSTMHANSLRLWRVGMLVSSVTLVLAGCWLLSLPGDPTVAARNAEEGFQFH